MLMRKSDPFGFDISVSSAKKKTRGKRGMSGAFETSTRACEHEGCTESGQYRAPKSPDNLDEYFWFCKTHVREYNLKWNFFTGATEEEMEAQMDKDRVWGRETKPFGRPSEEQRAWARLGVDDPHQVLGEKATQIPAARSPAPAACPDRAPRARDPRGPRYLDQGRDPQAVPQPDQGAAPRHERRRPVGRGTPAGGRLGLGADQGKPQLQGLSPAPAPFPGWRSAGRRDLWPT